MNNRRFRSGAPFYILRLTFDVLDIYGQQPLDLEFCVFPGFLRANGVELEATLPFLSASPLLREGFGDL